jgi:hypothetical protein
MTTISIPANSVELRTHSARSQIALNGRPAVAFGALFVLAGSGVMAQSFLASSERMHAPRGVIGMVGLVFALAGLFVVVNGIADIVRKRAVAQRAAASPDEPWWWDYEWQRDGIGNDTRREIIKAFAVAAFLELFLAPFHWIGFVSPQRLWIFGVGALLFDCVAIGMVVRGTRLLLMRRRYGPSWLRFGGFPFHTGERLNASLDGFGGLAALPALNATLRCVQERYETRGTGENRNTRVVCYALWSASATIARSRKGTFEIAFDLPADAPSSAVSERPARYWELVLDTGDVPGIDYSASFLVPVYAPRR